MHWSRFRCPSTKPLRGAPRPALRAPGYQAQYRTAIPWSPHQLTGMLRPLLTQPKPRFMGWTPQGLSSPVRERLPKAPDPQEVVWFSGWGTCPAGWPSTHLPPDPVLPFSHLQLRWVSAPRCCLLPVQSLFSGWNAPQTPPPDPRRLSSQCKNLRVHSL